MKKFEQELELEAAAPGDGRRRRVDGGLGDGRAPAARRGHHSQGPRRRAELDRFQVEIDGEAVRLITIYSPIAKDLRFLLMVARINSELERIGDQALNNSEYVEMFLSEPPPRRSTTSRA